MAKDSVEVAPHVYTVVFENERLRLLDVRVAPGASTEIHGHPDYLVYTLEGGKVRLADASGQSGEVEMIEGQAMWREAEEHSAVNIGPRELRALFIELK